MRKFRLEMLTPERSFFVGDVEGLVVTAPDGEREILANHMPIVIGVKPAMMRINTGEEVKICANGEGFVVVETDAVYIMCQTFEWPEEIELDRVNRAIEEHTKKLQEAKNMVDYRISKMTIARALARLKVKKFKDDNKL